jgi:hypothetical protein
MPDVRRVALTQRLQLVGAKASQTLDPLRTGMPALDSIRDDKTTFKPNPNGPTYRILKTTEVDAYEDNPAAAAIRSAVHGQKTPAPAALAAAAKLPVAKKKPAGKAKPGASSDDFAGTARLAAKLSIAAAQPAVSYSDVSELIASFTPVDQMVKLKIPTTQTSNRVKQENRNIHVTGFLYAASREADNDFHLIVGLDPNAQDEMYMTMEVSGLPPTSYPAFGALNTARTAYKQFFGTKNLPGAGYHFYQPPIPVEVQGSIFFDSSHDKGQAPGPPSLKSRMPTIWEVHPISSIKLGP